MERKDSQIAPGTLEVVRTFLNTWLIPNDTREPTDELESPSAMQRFYSTWFRDAGATEAHIVPELVRQLRADLRGILGTGDALALNEWLFRQPVAVRLVPGTEGAPILMYRPVEGRGCQLCAEILALVVEAIAGNTWTRLKACPDCQWVFYDHTKNKNKVWCLMTASGPQGRSCGSISKVRSFRARQKTKASPAPEDANF
ncbi:MAG TPA: CGNR zinc finger domain-containing protein [Ktedonobacterales bacterium]|jgi:predicted RNA-binding Zn ribbon-like protein